MNPEATQPCAQLEERLRFETYFPGENRVRMRREWERVFTEGRSRGELTARGMEVPCIVSTADDSDETRHMPREMNAAGFFGKPVDSMALLDAIRWAVPEPPWLPGRG